MQFLKISYQGGGLVRIPPEYVAYFRYFPDTKNDEDGIVVFYLKNREEVKICKCSPSDAKEYIKIWREALEANQGQLSDIPLLDEEEFENGETEAKRTDS